MSSEPSPRLEAEQGRTRWSTADLLSAVRIPLAIAFPFADNPVRLALLAAAAGSDLLDGQLARRFGSSSLGVVIDPVADKLFMASAFGVVALSGRLEWYEIVGALLRDIVATIAFVVTYFSRRPRSIRCCRCSHCSPSSPIQPPFDRWPGPPRRWRSTPSGTTTTSPRSPSAA
jgi:CDP-alcohol phosphatidyltransferase